MAKSFETIINEIIAQDPRYKPDAYAFMVEAFYLACRKIMASAKRSRPFIGNKVVNISGEALLESAKVLILREYGPMAKTVLHHWGIETTDDFGHIVGSLVAHCVLHKTEEDDYGHFHDAYDFDEVFEHGYHKQLAKKVSRMR